MKNRIPELFGCPETSNNSNILYNSYINRNTKQTELLKNFNFFSFKTWHLNLKIFIFALLIWSTTLISSANASPSKKIIAKTTANDDSTAKEDVDSVTNWNVETIRDLVLRESGLIIPKSLPDDHLMTMYNQAISKDIPISIFFRWIYTESVWKSNARSHDGAIGYTQLMPSTYNTYRKKLKLQKSAQNNIIVGAYYLREMYDYWNKRNFSERKKWALALACYNGNMSRVIRQQGVPKRSGRYVEWILKNGYE